MQRNEINALPFISILYSIFSFNSCIFTNRYFDVPSFSCPGFSKFDNSRIALGRNIIIVTLAR